MANIAPELLASHAWLAEMDEKPLTDLLEKQRSTTEDWVRELHWLTDEQMQAAFDDPRLPGLYIAEPDTEDWPPVVGYILGKRTETKHVNIYRGKTPAEARQGIVAYMMRVRAYACAEDRVVGECITLDPSMLPFEKTCEAFMEMARERFTIKNIGGKARVGWWQGDELELQTRNEFIVAHEHVRIRGEAIVKGKPVIVEKEVAKEWLRWPSKTVYDRVEFLPGLDAPDNVLNLWNGWAYQPSLTGNYHAEFLNFIYTVLCDYDDESYEYLLNWMARAVQQPHKQAETALVLRGTEEGTGKGFFANQFGKLFGRHFFAASNAKHVLGHFNGHLRRTILLFADEAFFAGDKKQGDALKGFITEPKLTYEKKGYDAEQDNNCIHLIIASNHDQVVEANEHARRFFVLDVSNSRQGDRPYFAGIEKNLKDGGYRDLMSFLQQRDISEWNPQPVPNTKGLQAQKNLTSEDSWTDAISGILHEIGVNVWEQQTDDEGKPMEHETRHACRVHSKVLLQALGIHTKDQAKRDHERLRKVMRELGFDVSGKNMKINNKQGKGYCREWDDADGPRYDVHWRQTWAEDLHDGDVLAEMKLKLVATLA